MGDSPKDWQVIALNDKGFAWQASIGARADQVEFVAASDRWYLGMFADLRKAAIDSINLTSDPTAVINLESNAVTSTDNNYILILHYFFLFVTQSFREDERCTLSDSFSTYLLFLPSNSGQEVLTHTSRIPEEARPAAGNRKFFRIISLLPRLDDFVQWL